jgi:signal transduction histidine kinase
MTRVHETGGGLLVCPDLAAALDEVLAATMEITGAERGHVHRLNARGDALGRRPEIFGRLQEGESWAGEFEMQSRSGSVVSVLVSGTPVLDEDGRLKAIVGVCVDISELKAAQQALKDDDRRKDELLAMLGHELRNPLGVIRMALQMLPGTTGDSERFDALQTLAAHLRLNGHEVLEDEARRCRPDRAGRRRDGSGAVSAPASLPGDAAPPGCAGGRSARPGVSRAA